MEKEIIDIKEQEINEILSILKNLSINKIYIIKRFVFALKK